MPLKLKRSGLFLSTVLAGSALGLVSESIVSNPTVIQYGRQTGFIPTTASGSIWYVNNAVVSSGDGTSVATPFKTIGEAYAAAQTDGGNSQQVRILLGSAPYRESITNDVAGLRFASHTDQQPIWTGSEVLSGWTQVTTGNKATHDPTGLLGAEADTGNIHVATLNYSQIAGSDGIALNLREASNHVPLAQERPANSDLFTLQYDEEFYRADSFTLNGSNQITAITDASVIGQYTNAQLLNAKVYLYGNPNSVQLVSVTAASGNTIDVSGSLVVQGNTPLPAADNLRYNLVNIAANIEQGQYAYRDNGDNTLTVFLWPNDPANLTSGIEFAAREMCLELQADDTTAENITFEGTAATSKLSGWAVGRRNSARGFRQIVNNCLVRHINNSAGDGYGAIHFQNSADVLVQNCDVQFVTGAFGIFLQGPALANPDTGNQIEGCHFARLSKTSVRVYTNHQVRVTYCFFEDAGKGSHTNLINFYENCEDVLCYGNKARHSFGYATMQEASSVFFGFNDFPCNTDPDDNRSFQDQANATPPPTIGSTHYFWNNQATPDPAQIGGPNEASSFDLGKPNVPGTQAISDARNSRFVFINNIVHGGGVSEPYAGLLSGEAYWPAGHSEQLRGGNIYTGLAAWQSAGNGWASLADEVVQTNLATLYVDAANENYAPAAGSPILTHNGIDLTSTIAAAQAKFPGFDFTRDMNKQTINVTAPKCGPRADPATWAA